MDEHRRKALFSNPFLGTSEQDIVEKRNAEKRVLAEQIAQRKLQKEDAKRKEQEQERRDAEKLARFVKLSFICTVLSSFYLPSFPSIKTRYVHLFWPPLHQ